MFVDDIPGHEETKETLTLTRSMLVLLNNAAFSLRSVSLEEQRQFHMGKLSKVHYQPYNRDNNG